MATLTLRIDKGSPLTNTELDDNFRQLNLTKIEVGGDIGGSTSAPSVISLRGYALSSSAPTTGQALTWSGTQWYPSTVVASGSSTVNINAVSSIVTSVVTSTVNNTVTSTVTSQAATVVSTTTTTYPTFSAYPNTSIQQTITANGAQQKVLFQNEEWDNANCFANSRFTPTVAGYYQLNATVRMDGAGAQEGMITIWKNGGEYHRGWNASGTTSGSNFLAMQVSALAYANGTSDYFEIYVQNSAGVNKDVTVAGQAGFGNITWFNGIYVPTQVITNVAASTTVSSTVASAANNAVTSTVVTNSVQAGVGITTVLKDISNYFNNQTQSFTLKVDSGSSIATGVHYGDNKDFTVFIGNRSYRPAVAQATLGPWIIDFTAEPSYTFKVTGSTITFYRAIEFRQAADIRINTLSASRQQRPRYPFSANSIVLGD